MRGPLTLIRIAVFILGLVAFGAHGVVAQDSGGRGVPGLMSPGASPTSPMRLLGVTATHIGTGAGAELGLNAATRFDNWTELQSYGYKGGRGFVHNFLLKYPRLFLVSESLIKNSMVLLGGALVNIAIQKATTGRIDWGSVAASSIGGFFGTCFFGPVGGMVGSLAGDLLWRGMRLLWNKVDGQA